ncbi:MAG: hypothetical protein RIQ52_578 [Pseudomonadota bacterium]|jgi:putative flippase GtrA
MRSFFSRQFLRFLITGGLAAGVNFGSRIVYNQWLSFSEAVVLAYVTGMFTAFVLARLLVFGRGSQTLKRSALYFILVNVVAVAQTWAISMGLAEYGLPALGIKEFVPEIAHATGVVFPVFTSYLGHRRWSFR